MAEQADVACANVPDPNDRANCIFDIKTTGDIETWKNAPFYSSDPIDPPVDDRCSTKGDTCKTKGGTCVFDCVETDNNQCVIGMCSESGQLGNGMAIALARLQRRRIVEQQAAAHLLSLPIGSWASLVGGGDGA
jgi:hypothetical protein